MAALRLWQARVDAELITEGFSFMAGAQGQLLQLIDHGGTPQSQLTERAGAAQQIPESIESLIRFGALIRESDAQATLRLTDLGKRGLHANREAIRRAESKFSDSLSPEHSESYQTLIRLLQDQSAP